MRISTDSLQIVHVLVSMTTELDDHTPILSPNDQWYNICLAYGNVHNDICSSKLSLYLQTCFISAQNFSLSSDIEIFLSYQKIMFL